MTGPHSLPTCPGCGHVLTDDEMHGHEDDLWALAPNEGRTVIKCPVCDIEYHVQGGYTPEYTSAFAEEDL